MAVLPSPDRFAGPITLARRRMAAIDRRHRLHDGPGGHGPDRHVATGHRDIDVVLGGGLACGRLHEIFAAQRDDAAAATGFAAVLAGRAGTPILWLRQDRAQQAGGGLYAPGLCPIIGIDTDALLLALLPDPLALLRAAADAVRCPGVGSVVIELWQHPAALDLTASRRLALASAASGVTALMLRVDAQPAPSAAWTRWQVAAAPSIPWAANAPGHPAFAITLLRQRSRSAGRCWTVEWNSEQRCFTDAAASVPADRSVASSACGWGAEGVARRQRADKAPVSGAVFPLSGHRPTWADGLRRRA